jgi:hypothetical protein
MFTLLFSLRASLLHTVSPLYSTIFINIFRSIRTVHVSNLFLLFGVNRENAIRRLPPPHTLLLRLSLIGLFSIVVFLSAYWGDSFLFWSPIGREPLVIIESHSLSPCCCSVISSC